MNNCKKSFVFALFILMVSNQLLANTLSGVNYRFPSSFKLINDLDYCQSKNAQCGRLVKQDTQEIVLCPSCPSGESCVTNRCEPKCQSYQFGAPVDSLLLHMPMLINQDDLSGENNVISTDYFQDGDEEEGFTSNTNFSGKKIIISLPKLAQNPVSTTLSFKIIPLQDIIHKTILRSKNIKVIDKGQEVLFQIKGMVKNSQGKIRKYQVKIDKSELKTSSCNHILWLFAQNGFELFINSKKYSISTEPGDYIETLPQSITVGRYSGKIWSLRVYSRKLQQDEIGELSKLCVSGPSLSPPEEGYPNFLCGAYVCIWWPLDSDLEEGEDPIPLANYRYHLKKQDEVFEKNVIHTGMYLHRDLCNYLLGNLQPPSLNIILNYGLRKGFVKNFDENRTISRHWIHENFHAFQGRLFRYSGIKGKKFLLEATASWAPDTLIPGTPKTVYSLLGMYTFISHLPLWTTKTDQIDEPIASRFSGGHQYGAYIFFSYITRYILNDRFIGDVFNDERAKSRPIEIANELLAKAGYDLKEVFSDFAAKTINFDYLYSDIYHESEKSSCKRMYSKDDDYNKDTCIEDSPKILMRFNEQGTNDTWLQPPEEYKVGSWAYNVYEISTKPNGSYTFSISVDSDNPEYTEFQGRLVITNPDDNTYGYQSFPAMKIGDVQSITMTPLSSTKVYLVVIATPDIFKDFDSYNYHFKITKNSSLGQGCPIKKVLTNY